MNLTFRKIAGPYLVWSREVSLFLRWFEFDGESSSNTYEVWAFPSDYQYSGRFFVRLDKSRKCAHNVVNGAKMLCVIEVSLVRVVDAIIGYAFTVRPATREDRLSLPMAVLNIGSHGKYYSFEMDYKNWDQVIFTNVVHYEGKLRRNPVMRFFLEQD